MAYRLTKSVSSENYPINPTTSSIRRLTLQVQPQNPVDLEKSYLIVKNTLSTTLRGVAGVARNVGWGTQLAETKVVEYPNTCQIRTASMSVDGMVVEYLEDVNVRTVNMDQYQYSTDELRKWANVGKWGFQRLEGARIPALGNTPSVLMDGQYLSPFLERKVDANGEMTEAAQYKELPAVVHLSDIFNFAKMAGKVNLAGKQVKIELQFEDRFDLLTEVLNYVPDCSGAAPTTRPGQTFQVNPASITDNAGAAVVIGTTTNFRITSTSKFRSVAECPFYVGQPICLWLNGAAPAVTGSNYAIIERLALAADGSLYIYFKQYDLGAAIRSGGAAITLAQFTANVVVAGAPQAGVCVGITSVYDPQLTAGPGNDNLQFAASAIWLGAGLQTQYSITGLEMVLAEMPGASVAGKMVEYVEYHRDFDTIAAGQLYYQKTFQLDPMTAAVFALAPPTKITATPCRNMFFTNRQPGVSAGLSMRNLMNGVQLYSRDIVFSDTNSVAHPIHLDRLEMAMEAAGLNLQQLGTNAAYVMTDYSQHVLIGEMVDMSEQNNQLQLRLSFTTNTDARNIYVYKAVVKELKL